MGLNLMSRERFEILSIFLYPPQEGRIFLDEKLHARFNMKKIVNVVIQIVKHLRWFRSMISLFFYRMK